MYYFTNIKNTPYSFSIVKKMTEVYEYKGKETYYLKTFNNNISLIKENVVSNQAEYSGKFLNIKLSNQRYKLLTRQNASHQDRRENLVVNLLESFKIIHNSDTNWNLTTNGVIEIHDFIFAEFDPHAGIKNKRNKLEKKNELDTLISTFNKLMKEDATEYISLFSAFIIDFINIKPFNEYNEYIAIVLLTLLLKQYGYNVVDFVSLFNLIEEDKQSFKDAITKSGMNWELGLPQYHFFINYILELLIVAYQKLELLHKSFQFDKQYSKEELIEQTIANFTSTFTKEEIRELNPFISDSTINRTLKALRDQGIIEPTGKGRSAKWKKVRKGTFQIY
ncbi:Fic family protein [Haloplasma contractile]|uniref:Filamentation induced by cAMP protein fic n=1 Tax=Haloplasma contractile SSD-17B TaxID=1033810 RepID=U2FS08_9MOLU|nr:filamentation induced by cAMP protein Fic [Haloplasma contractile]ERJ13749.1 filamentation induced by cAMP protein fic [Haloplasma contractile SSD-17B]